MAWANQGSLGRGKAIKETISKNRQSSTDRMAMVSMRDSVTRVVSNKIDETRIRK